MAVGTMNDMAAHSLDLVGRELAHTLDAARRELEDYVDGHSAADGLERAAELLHLARGALKIVEIHGAALLTEEMEQTCKRLAGLGEGEEAERSVEALTRAMVQLPAYLDRLLSGGRDVALVLLPLINDLRAARGKPLLSEGTLLLLNTGPYERHMQSAPSTAPVARGFEKVAQRLRPPFQAALLGWIRGVDAERSLDELLRITEQLEQAASTEQVKQLWSVLGGVLIALRSNGLEGTVTLKRLIGQADRQLKRLIDGGESVLVNAPPVDLLNNLLYYVARADSQHERLQAIRDRYGLQDVLPGEQQLEQAREGLAGPSVKLMRTVAEAIKEDLGQVKDALDIFVRTGSEQADQLAPQLEMLKKIGDTLGVLGLERARAQIQQETDALAALVAGNRPGDPALLEKVAATLLDVEDALDRELVRAVLPTDGEESKGEPDEAAQQRHVTQAVMRECIVNLAKVKEAVIQLVEDRSNVRALDQVKPLLRGITAGLLMLSKTKAVRVVERIGRVISTRLVPGVAQPRPEHLERLADAIVSVEYYMETVSAGRSDPWYMLDNAERCLDLLDTLPAPPQAAEPSPPPRKPAEPAQPPSVMEVDEERSDPELVELFIEEAKEEIANIGRHLPVWQENLHDTEALIAVRRSFHTLKGSGRMVGAQLIGEFAWSVESLLNRLINQTLEPTPAIVAFIGEAAKAVPQLLEQLEIGLPPKVDVHALMQRAEALAAGDQPPAEAPAAQAAPAPEPPPPAMDPVLADIFAKEMRAHLATLRSHIEQARASGAPRVVDEPLYRACHTLLGSARMAAFDPGIELATPLAEHLRAHFEAESALDAAGLAALEKAADCIEAMASSVESGRPFAVDPEVVAALRALAPAAAAAPSAEPPAAEPPAEEEPAAAAASFDPEIAAIFTEESAEILDSAELALQSVRQNDPGAVVELQRLLHTLKGGARMAGVTTMGDLSHALETLLADMAAGRVAPTGPAVDLVQRALDHLHHMRDAVEAGRLPEAAVALRQEIEALHAGGVPPAAPAGEPQPAAPPAPPAEAPPEPEIAFEAEPAAEAEEAPAPADAAAGDESSLLQLTDADIAELEAIELGTMPELQAPAVSAEEQAEEPEEIVLEGDELTLADERSAAELLAAAEAAAEPAEPSEAPPAAAPPPAAAEAPPAAAEAEPAQPAPKAPEPRAAERAETARVDAALLDALLNAAGEINIFQSRLKQQLRSTEFHLGELAQTVARLREQLRKLEAETEAQIINRHEEDAGREGFDPLELDQYSTIQQLSRALAETANDVASINELLRGLTTEADTLLTQQTRVTAELQDGLMQTRMVPFHRHVSRLARIVRQACADTRKQATLVVEGEHSELDRQVLENMLPPFEHLLRNAVVHGIEDPATRKAAGKPETGEVRLKLRREGSEVIVEVADDGAGLNVRAIKRKAVEQGLIRDGQEIDEEQAKELILKPGFSTAGELTQAAGRGVGMDVVDNEVKKLGGSLRIESAAGKGTRFIVRLPYTLAITHALIVNVGDETFALPLPTVEGITRLSRERILELLTQDEPKLEYGGVTYRIQHLGSLVGGAPSALPEDESAVSLVLVRAGDNSSALLTDSLEGSREIVVKTLGPHLASVPGVTGATILGDGRVIVILDALTLVRQQRTVAPVEPAAAPAARELTALVVDDSITMRRVTQRLLERRGVRVLTARDGLDAITVLQEHEVDIILLDIEMPRMDGYQFATHVRNDPKIKDVPIIMITSRSGEKHRAKAIEIGVNDYLSKPYQESQLIAAIEALLGRTL
ncbi:MAG TPA: Hpt domain-containing protein [Gammaproteobacteria bacterium]